MSKSRKLRRKKWRRWRGESIIINANQQFVFIIKFVYNCKIKVVYYFTFLHNLVIIVIIVFNDFTAMIEDSKLNYFFYREP